jgi:ketosteroid isomerase-like protein
MKTRLFDPLIHPAVATLSRRGLLHRLGGASLAAAATALLPAPTLAQETTPTGDAEANTAVARRFHELFRHEDLAAADDLLAPDFTWHSPPQTIFKVGAEDTKQLVTDIRGFFPDLVLKEEDVIAAGDRVVIRWTLTGTAQTERGAVPIVYTGIDIFRLADGKVAEIWQNTDDLGLEEQLGNIPTEGTPTA